MANFIGVIAVILIIALSAGYVIKAKKRGVKCIGCSCGESCSGGGSCGGCSRNECKCGHE